MPKFNNNIDKYGAERDDSASEPYSDELDISSPEVLDFGDDGQVVFNSDWQEKKKDDDDQENDDLEKDQEEEEDDDDDESEDEGEENQVEYDDDGIDDPVQDMDPENVNNKDSNSDDDDDDDDDATTKLKTKLSNTSFGSLVKAQSIIQSDTQKKKRKVRDDDEDRLNVLRKRLKELQDQSSFRTDNFKSNLNKNKSNDEHEDQDEDRDKNDSDQKHSRHQHPRHQRQSKHAPLEQSSKFAVSRKRSIIDLPKNTTRDPRFDPSSDQQGDSERFKRNYKFLENYEDDEIKQLQTTLKSHNGKSSHKSKKKLTTDQVESLKRELIAKESKRAARMTRENEEQVRKQHKKKERELVAQGKKPFFLKDSEMKKQVLISKFQGLSEGKREKIMEKRRRRIGQKERRRGEVPNARRA